MLRSTPEGPRTTNDLPLFGRRMSIASRADHLVLRPGGRLASRMGISAINQAVLCAHQRESRNAACLAGRALPERRWLPRRAAKTRQLSFPAGRLAGGAVSYVAVLARI